MENQKILFLQKCKYKIRDEADFQELHDNFVNSEFFMGNIHFFIKPNSYWDNITDYELDVDPLLENIWEKMFCLGEIDFLDDVEKNKYSLFVGYKTGKVYYLKTIKRGAYTFATEYVQISKSLYNFINS